jgi:hypothetical protein
MNERQRLERAAAKLLRKHHRTFMGHCKCGWRRSPLNQFGDPEPDHDDHVGKIIADCMWAVVMK